jgi:hypothetical protein
MAQAVEVPIGQNQPDPLATPAAPATTLAPDGVRNGTTKEERDQHTRAGENPDRAATTILPEPDPRSGCTQLVVVKTRKLKPGDIRTRVATFEPVSAKAQPVSGPTTCPISDIENSRCRDLSGKIRPSVGNVGFPRQRPSHCPLTYGNVGTPVDMSDSPHNDTIEPP